MTEDQSNSRGTVKTIRSRRYIVGELNVLFYTKWKIGITWERFRKLVERVLLISDSSQALQCLASGIVPSPTFFRSDTTINYSSYCAH